MANPLIQLALDVLQAEDFTALEAGPGTKAPSLTDLCAAVRIEKVDWTQLKATLAVNVLCPVHFGAVRCQEEALRAGEVLTRAGARCTQGRCAYDGLARTFSVEILAEFSCSLQQKDIIPDTGTSQSQEKMTFKTFTWPSNPENYREELTREPIYVKNGVYWTYYGMQPSKRVITGSGAFSGPNAYDTFKALEALYPDTEPGILTHPVWGSRNVYFLGLEMKQSSQPEYVAYSFEFRETDENGDLPR